MRQLGIAAFWLSLVALVGTLVLGGSARASLLGLQDATPAASPAAEAAVPETDAITLVASYLPDPAGDTLILRPIETDEDLIADLTDADDEEGRVDFAAIGDGLPRITLDDSTFDSYLRYEGDPEGGLRWTWFFDAPGTRPATLVVQVAGTGGIYNGYNGTATFVSRAEDAGGVLVIVVNPPEDDTGTPAAGGADDAAVDATAPATDATTPTTDDTGDTGDTGDTDDAAPTDETPVGTIRRP